MGDETGRSACAYQPRLIVLLFDDHSVVPEQAPGQNFARLRRLSLNKEIPPSPPFSKWGELHLSLSAFFKVGNLTLGISFPLWKRGIKGIGVKLRKNI